jgi:hypothetical protein
MRPACRSLCARSGSPPRSRRSGSSTSSPPPPPISPTQHQTLVGPRFPNWVSLDGSWGRLRSESLGVEWSAPEGAELHAGRELIRPDFDWAGLDYLVPARFAGTTYHVNVQEAR